MRACVVIKQITETFQKLDTDRDGWVQINYEQFMHTVLTLLSSATPLGELRHIQKLRFWPLADVLHDKYLLPKEEADMIASFLNPMLRLIPEKRAKASELIHHAWLDGIVVQGEIDAIRRAEDEDRKRRAAAAPGKAPAGPLTKSAADAQEEDAMKPVDDAVGADDVPKIAVPVPAAGKEHAVLVNAHLDSTLPSPGAADDALSVGVMLECLRVLVGTPDWEPRHAIVFCECCVSLQLGRAC